MLGPVLSLLSRAAVPLVLTGAVVATAPAAAPAGQPGSGRGTAPVIVVADGPGARQQVAALGGRVTRELPIVDGFAATIPAGTETALRRVTGVRSVSPDGAVTLSAAPAAPAAANLLAKAKTGGSEPTSVFPKALRADKVWKRSTGAGVTVAVVDTGVSAHSDLAGRIVPVTSAGTTSSCQNFSTETTCADLYGHGTFVAGVISGKGAGRSGVAPDAGILAVKVAGADGTSTVSTVLAAIQWVVSVKDTYRVRVLNLSLATDSAQSYRTDPFNLAVERAWDAGIVVVVAASNRGPGPSTISKPADDPLVITVGAIDDRGSSGHGNDELPDFSSRGPTRTDGLAKPDVVAPGAHVESLRVSGSTIATLSGSPDGLYLRGSGTSFAAAGVSGVAALVVALNPAMTPDQVKYAITHSTKGEQGGTAQTTGTGLVQADGAAVKPPAGSANAGVVRSDGSGAPPPPGDWPGRNWAGDFDGSTLDGTTLPRDYGDPVSWSGWFGAWG